MLALRDFAVWKDRDDQENGSIGVVPMHPDVGQGYLVMTWYKDRGATGSAVILNDDRPRKSLTLKTAERLLEALCGGKP
jgi:hypothetical protein